jgi:mannose-1-phosphate guanylyltransferase/mannose-6-phosphate isomerase
MLIIILCGGSGTRLWPLSRTTKPKQLHNLVSSNSLLYETVNRIRKIADDNYYIFMTNKSIYYPLQNEINNLLTDNYTILVEPIAKNTAPAILIAIQYALFNKIIISTDQVLVVSSDHIWDDDKFADIINETKNNEYDNNIITIGIKPTIPHTGYGYIKKNINNNQIEEFKEKPNIEQAIIYLQDSNYYWNSGTFIFKCYNMISAFLKYQYDLFIISNNIVATIKENNIDIDLYDKMNDISIDYAIMEYIDNGIVLPYDGNWNDIGSWDSLYNIGNKDIDNNVKKGYTITHNTANSYIYNDTKSIITTNGLNNIVVINTEDALLISDKDKVQDIKKIVNQITDKKLLTRFNSNNLLEWGSYDILVNNNLFLIQLLTILPNKRIVKSPIKNYKYIIVKNGICTLEIDDLFIYKDYNINESIVIESRQYHNILNRTNENLLLLEIIIY